MAVNQRSTQPCVLFVPGSARACCSQAPYVSISKGTMRENELGIVLVRFQKGEAN
jgi:hypothetical protein